MFHTEDATHVSIAKSHAVAADGLSLVAIASPIMESGLLK